MSVSRPLIFALIDAPAARLGLSASEKLLLIAFVSHMNPAKNGSVVWPSQQRLADMTALAVGTVRRITRNLENAGMIKRQANDRRHNLYSINSGLIHSLCDSAHHERYSPGQNDHTAHHERYIPLTMSGNTAHHERLIAKEQPSGTVNVPVRRKISQHDGQRKMPLAGVVAEQPTRNKQTNKQDWQSAREAVRKAVGGGGG